MGVLTNRAIARKGHEHSWGLGALPAVSTRLPSGVEPSQFMPPYWERSRRLDALLYAPECLGASGGFADGHYFYTLISW